MIKTTYICDKCKTEMAQAPSSKITLEQTLFSIVISVAPKDSIPEQHICKYCIVDLITNQLDDRPKIVSYQERKTNG